MGSARVAGAARRVSIVDEVDVARRCRRRLRFVHSVGLRDEVPDPLVPCAGHNCSVYKAGAERVTSSRCLNTGTGVLQMLASGVSVHLQKNVLADCTICTDVLRSCSM